MKDSIDFGKENVALLFRRMFYPTLSGMIFSALFIITDGVFVGRGLGSDALAAVNIVAPIWLFATGVGLMFGMGASVVASIHLARGKVKVARINTTQALGISSLFLLLCSAGVLIFSGDALQLLGCSPRLFPLAEDYLLGFAPFMAVNGLLSSGGFFIRLSGAPGYFMRCAILSALLNALFDYLFIFVFGWGIFGAAIATSLGSMAGAGFILAYLFDRRHILHFVRVKFSAKSLRLTLRNVVYMCRLGFSSFLCEAAVACMMLCGNYAFMAVIGEDGVAAFSIACYFFPIVFMLYNSIAQSVQPIISYNYGSNAYRRVRDAFALSLKTAVGCAVGLFVVTIGGSSIIVSMFIASNEPAHAIAAAGLPLFALGFIPFAVNIVSIGYFQSVERIGSAMSVTLMRGFVLMALCFGVLPCWFGVQGAWLAVPVAETLAVLLVVGIYCYRKR